MGLGYDMQWHTHNLAPLAWMCGCFSSKSVSDFPLQSFNFPPLTSAAGYQISYRSRSTSLVSTEHSETQYTITGLQTNVTYSIRVRARFHFSQYCASTTFRNAEWSTTVTATTIETGKHYYYYGQLLKKYVGSVQGGTGGMLPQKCFGIVTFWGWFF